MNRAETVSRHDPISPIYRAYNGVMLGLFTAGSLLADHGGKQRRRGALLRRVVEFLAELSNDTQNSLQLDESAGNIEDAVDRAARTCDEQLADYYQLGLATFRYVITAGSGRAAARDRKKAERVLHELGHPPVIFRGALEAESVASQRRGRTSQDIFTICLRLVRELIVGVIDEADTCFVAIPFTKLFEQRYLLFYRQVADRLNYQAIRAWGGIAREEHQELLLALIAKTGLLMADVTIANANVALEIGVALGQGKTPLLLADQSRWKRAANIQLDWVYPYHAVGRHWESAAAERAGLYFTMLRALRKPGTIPSWSSRPVDVLRMMSEIDHTTAPSKRRLSSPSHPTEG